MDFLSVIDIVNDKQFDGDEYQVKSYSLLIVPKVGEAEAFSMPGNVFSDQIKESIKTLKSGDKILMDDITYTRRNGTKGICSPLMIKVK